MTKRERQVMRDMVESIYHEWHCCGLSASDAKAMGLKPGRLCDSCRSMVIARMKTFKQLTEAA